MFDELTRMGRLAKRFRMSLVELEQLGTRNVQAYLTIQSELDRMDAEQAKKEKESNKPWQQ